MRAGELLGKAELNVQFLGNDLRDERAFDQRTAYRLHVVRGE